MMRRVRIAVALAIVLAAGFWTWQRDHARKVEQEQREVALRKTLLDLRGAIDDFRRQHGRYPHSLEELGPVPVDPITGKADWRVTTEETVRPSEDFTATVEPKPEVFVIEVHSNAPGHGDT